MKVFRKIALIFSLFSVVAVAAQNWRSHSANILPQKRFEVGLFQPFRYGYNQTLEYSVYPIWFFLMPNITIKKSHEDFQSYSMATKWSMYYPGPLLNLAAKEGVGGFIDPNLEIPSMIGLSASLLMSNTILDMDITFNSGFDIGFSLGDLDNRVNIELPLLYHRLSVFHNNYGFHTGLDIGKNITKKISTHIDFDFSILPGLDTKKTDSGIAKLLGEYSFEHKALLIYEKSDTFRFLTGYKFVHGEYPFGSESRILPFLFLVDAWVPIIELQWGRSLK